MYNIIAPLSFHKNVVQRGVIYYNAHNILYGLVIYVHKCIVNF